MNKHEKKEGGRENHIVIMRNLIKDDNEEEIKRKRKRKRKRRKRKRKRKRRRRRRKRRKSIYMVFSLTFTLK